MSMKNPPHPGLSVRHDCLEPLGLSVTEAARKLGISRKQLSDKGDDKGDAHLYQRRRIKGTHTFIQ